MESTLCPLCDTNEFDVVRVETFTTITRGKDRSFPVVTCVCKACGHVFSNPRPDKKELADYYRNYYREDFDPGSFPEAYTNLYRSDVDWIISKIGAGEGRRAFEIGAYAGYLLSMLRDKRWEVSGIEPTESAVAAAESLFDLKLLTGLFEDLSVPDPANRFDLVVMGAVLEHVSDPTAVLLKVNRFLKDNGYLFVRVPDASKPILNSVGDIFTLEHPNMFSPQCLRLFYEKCGFAEMGNTRHDGWPRHIISIAKKVVTTRLALQITPDYSTYLNMKKCLSDYGRFLDEIRAEVNHNLAHLVSPHRKRVLIYGAGNHTEFLLQHTDIGKAEILGLSDSNPHKWSAELFGYKVHSPKNIAALKPDAIVISSRAFQDDIYRCLKHHEDNGIEVLKLYGDSSSRIIG